jgi:hypothetical protein
LYIFGQPFAEECIQSVRCKGRPHDNCAEHK